MGALKQNALSLSVRRAWRRRELLFMTWLRVPSPGWVTPVYRLTVFAVFTFLCGTPALADPCKAIPDRGPAPSWARAGFTITGQVRHVGDGDSICVSGSADPQTWVEIRLADFYAPELAEPGGQRATAAMEGLTRGRQVTCTAERGESGRVVSFDRLIAVCRIGRVSLGDMMRRAGVREGGRGS